MFCNRRKTYARLLRNETKWKEKLVVEERVANNYAEKETSFVLRSFVTLTHAYKLLTLVFVGVLAADVARDLFVEKVRL